MKCNNCNIDIPEGIKFCPSCGAPIVVKDEKTEVDVAKDSLLMYIFVLIGIGIIFGIIELDETLSSTIGQLLCVFALIWVNRKKLSGYAKTITKKTIGWGILLGLASIGFGLLFGLFVHEPASNQATIEEMFRKNWLLISIPIILCAPIIEEIVCRMNLKSFIKNNTVFVIVSALIFWFLHMSFSIASIEYFVLGLVFAIAYLKTENIYTPILAHFVNNLIVTIVMFFTIL